MTQSFRSKAHRISIAKLIGMWVMCASIEFHNSGHNFDGIKIVYLAIRCEQKKTGKPEETELTDFFFIFVWFSD